MVEKVYQTVYPNFGDAYNIVLFEKMVSTVNYEITTGTMTCGNESNTHTNTQKHTNTHAHTHVRMHARTRTLARTHRNRQGCGSRLIRRFALKFCKRCLCPI